MAAFSGPRFLTTTTSCEAGRGLRARDCGAREVRAPGASPKRTAVREGRRAGSGAAAARMTAGAEGGSRQQRSRAGATADAARGCV